MFGVSPAYFLSLFSPDFTLLQVREQLPAISALGFSHLELETFTRDQLQQWGPEEAEKTAAALESLDLQVSQFVCHHLLKHFSDPRSFNDPDLFSDFGRIVKIVSAHRFCGVLTLPQPQVYTGKDLHLHEYRKIRRTYLDSLSRLLDIAGGASLTLALEVMPGSFVGNSDGFLSIADTLGAQHLGFNFDTGHAWACKEAVALIPLKLGSRIACTHLSDNYGHENLSNAPGRGTVPWQEVMRNLHTAGYSGPYDIEIRCDEGEVSVEYSSARQFLNSLLEEVLEVHHAAQS